MKFKYYLFLFITLCVSKVIFAEAQQVQISKKITKISVYTDLVFVSFEPAFEFEQGCSNGGNVTVSIDMSNDNGKAIYSAALAAASQGKTVGFGVSGCHQDRPRAYRIDVSFQ